MCPDRPTRFRSTVTVELDWKNSTFGELLKAVSKSHAVVEGESWAVMTPE